MDYQRLTNYRNECNFFAKLLHITILEIKEGFSIAEMPFSEDLLNPAGSIHGGSIFTIADVVGSAAASSYGFHVTTVDSSFHYLNPVLSSAKLIAKTRELKKGKRLLVYNISVEDQNGLSIAEGIFTYMLLNKEIF